MRQKKENPRIVVAFSCEPELVKRIEQEMERTQEKNKSRCIEKILNSHLYAPSI